MNTFPAGELGYRSQIVNAAGSKLVGSTIYTMKAITSADLISPAPIVLNVPIYTAASTANTAPVTTLLHPFNTTRVIAGATIYKLV
jgi:hypothetical protein